MNLFRRLESAIITWSIPPDDITPLKGAAMSWRHVNFERTFLRSILGPMMGGIAGPRVSAFLSRSLTRRDDVFSALALWNATDGSRKRVGVFARASTRR